ncbi:hypothetical protein PQR05_29650 [Paraburkholderia sediminicola]|uniref:hypothetical protein n=1 Tax=Paraburkholderia sediminicola TaxID=458836 RepID=UPI0038BD09DB
MSAVLDDTILDVTDTSEGRTLALVTTAEKLTITEVLDALPKDAEGNAITGIVPLKYDLTDTLLAQFKQQYVGVAYAVDTPEGKAAAKEAVSRLSKLKKGMDDAYKAWNSPIMAMTKNAREQKDYAQTELAAIIDPIQAQLDKQKAEEDRIKNEAAVAESRRIEGHTAALTALQKLPERYVQASVTDIEAALADLTSFEYLTRRDWQEYAVTAQDAQRQSVETLRMHLTNASAREKLAALEAEQAQTESARQAEEQQRDAERARVDALRERITNIQMAPMTAIGSSAAGIQKTLDRLELVKVEEFGDMQQQAQDAINISRTALSTLLAGAKATEAATAQAEAQATEMQRLQDVEAERKREEQAREDAAAATARAAEEQREREAQAERAHSAAAAADAKARAEAVAETVLALLIEARPHVIGSSDEVRPGLIEEIDAAIAAVQGE